LFGKSFTSTVDELQYGMTRQQPQGNNPLNQPTGQ